MGADALFDDNSNDNLLLLAIILTRWCSLFSYICMIDLTLLAKSQRVQGRRILE